MPVQILAFLLFFQVYLTSQPAGAIVYRSVDGGQTWQDASGGLPNGLQVRDVFSEGGAILLAAESGLFRNANPFSTPNWEKPGFLNMTVNGIFPGLNGPYVYNSGKGLFQEISGTGIWVQKYPDFKDRMVFTVLEIPGGSLFIGCDNGLFRSNDGGKNWKQIFVEDGIMSITTANGALVGSGFRGLWRSTDNGNHWERVQAGEGVAFQIALLDEGIAAVTSGPERAIEEIANGLLFSSDGGKTWEHRDKGLPPVRRIYDIEQAGGNLFCSLDTGIYRSSDRGKTWELVRPVKGEQRFELAVSGQTLYAVVVAVVDGC